METAKITELGELLKLAEIVGLAELKEIMEITEIAKMVVLTKLMVVAEKVLLIKIADLSDYLNSYLFYNVTIVTIFEHIYFLSTRLNKKVQVYLRNCKLNELNS